MKIEARGWDRDCGFKELFNKEIINEKNMGNFHIDECTIHGLPTGRVSIMSGTKNANLNGNYIIRIEFSKEDVAKLAMESFKSSSFDE